MIQVSKNTTPRRAKTARGQRTLRKLLDAAQAEFGAKGFHDSSVAGITAAAGVAQGTFYLYFDGKEALFGELVLDLGHRLRNHLSEHMDGAPDRIEGERRGLSAFIAFVRDHPDLYRIVMEAQFVDPAAYRRYFSDFGRAYSANLAKAVAQGEIRPGPVDARAWAIMGMSLFLGLRYGIWEPDHPLPGVVDTVIDMLAHGLTPTQAGS